MKCFLTKSLNGETTFLRRSLGSEGWNGMGEHLAVGNDALKAEKLCELAAEQTGGFAFPTVWYGEPRTVSLLEGTHDKDGKVISYMKFRRERFTEEYAGFRRTPEEQIQFYKDLLFHVLVQMNTLEMRAVCLLCGHYPLHAWATEVVERFNAAFADTQAFAGIEFHYPGKSDNVGGDHAAKWETSYLWYLRPDCVDMSLFLHRKEEPLIGVLGDDPRNEASIELGRKACELIVNGMAAKAAELIQKCRGGN
jgi:creatinine amidohydrolase/Fe(II)-dependent formamide hydrolase-like protein